MLFLVYWHGVQLIKDVNPSSSCVDYVLILCWFCDDHVIKSGLIDDNYDKWWKYGTENNRAELD